MATIKASKVPPLEVIVWANIKKWQMIRGIDDEQLTALLGIKTLKVRRRTKFLTLEEMGLICAQFDIEPERLLER